MNSCKVVFALSMAAIGYFLIYILQFSIFPIDDAFIHYRIARNIVEHGLPYYNISERVLGSSPHLWINFVALLFKLSNYNLALIPYVVWLFTSACFLCLKYLLQTRFTKITATIFAFLIIVITLLPTAAGLMEEPFALFFVLLAAVFLQKQKVSWAAVCAGLSLWVRVEFIVLIALGLFMVKKVDRLRYFLYALLPVTIYLIYTFYYFGTPLPLPMISKPIVFGVPLVDFLTNLPSVHSYPIALRFIWPNTLKAICTAVSLVSLYSILLYEAHTQRSARWIVWMLLLSICILVSYTLRQIYVFSWYTPLFSIPVALACALLLQKRTRLAGGLFLIVGFFNIFYISAVDTFAFLSGKTQYYDEYATGQRVQRYLEIGAELYNKNPQARLLTSEIGALGWTFKGLIFDGAALISPDALKYHPMSVPQDRPWPMAGAIPYQVVLDWKPDYLVSLPIFSVAVRREIEAGHLPLVLTKSYPIPIVWSNNHIDLFESK